jgi:hypothetical protein
MPKHQALRSWAKTRETELPAAHALWAPSGSCRNPETGREVVTGLSYGGTWPSLAFPGVIPLFSERCLVQKVPPDVSMVFFEFCVADMATDVHTLNTSDRRALETMMRYVLDLPSRPALVFMCMYRLLGESDLRQ